MEGEIAGYFDREGAGLDDSGRGEREAFFEEGDICGCIGRLDEHCAWSCLGELFDNLLAPEAGALVVLEFKVGIEAGDLRIWNSLAVLSINRKKFSKLTKVNEFDSEELKCRQNVQRAACGEN